jgi:hypothetical protein
VIGYPETILMLARDRQVELRQEAAACQATGAALERLIARLWPAAGRARAARLDSLK